MALIIPLITYIFIQPRPPVKNDIFISYSYRPDDTIISYMTKLDFTCVLLMAIRFISSLMKSAYGFLSTYSEIHMVYGLLLIDY